MKKLFAIFTLILFALGGSNSVLNAQNDGLDLSVDFMSRYVWRGTAFGNSPSIQPTLAFTKGNFEIGAWGAFSTNGIVASQELDFYLSYSFSDALSITITDYFFPTDGAVHNYWEYNEDKTGHIFEGALSFAGTEKIPVGVLVGVNFYGADAITLVDDPNSAEFNQKDGIQYSTYLELSWSGECKNGTALDAFAGMTLNSPAEADNATGFIGETGFYGNTMGFVNIGVTASKELEITDKFNLPVSCSLITNPMAENIYMVFGFSL